MSQTDQRARDVGPYLGLTPRRYQSGKRIDKARSRNAETALPEPASMKQPAFFLLKCSAGPPLKAWGTRLARRIGSKKARVAIAGKIAVILQCIWTDGTEFWWNKEARPGLIPIHPPSSAPAETLPWLGRRVETTASSLLPMISFGKRAFHTLQRFIPDTHDEATRADLEENRDPGQGTSFRSA